jgi:hypothetical protein
MVMVEGNKVTEIQVKNHHYAALLPCISHAVAQSDAVSPWCAMFRSSCSLTAACRQPRTHTKVLASAAPAVSAGAAQQGSRLTCAAQLHVATPRHIVGACSAAPAVSAGVAQQ